MEIIDEAGLDDEIEQADIVRERIELAIIDLDSALDDLVTRSHKPSISAAEAAGSGQTDNPPPIDTHTCPLAPLEGGSGGSHSHESTPTPSRTHSRATTPPTETPMPDDSLVHRTQVKLSKLTLKKFNGDLMKWMTFWDTFESAVHNNATLSSIDKFNYLNSMLESAAAEAIAGLTLTSANYEEAIETLKRRFGNKQLML